MIAYDLTLNKLREKDLSEEVIQGVFIGKHIDTEGRFFFYPKVETALVGLCTIVITIAFACLVKIGFEIHMEEGYRSTVKLAVILTIFFTVGMPTYTLYRLSLHSFIACYRFKQYM